MISGRPAKILLIDSNVYFAKRLGDALKKEGFEVLSSTQPAFALTTLEYDAPAAVVCATNMREMGALEIAKIIHADPKNATLPIIALGDGSQRALMEAFQAGCEDYIDRQRPPAVIATHIRNIVISKAEGFQPTQMLAQADTSLSGSLTHHDLPGVLQMLGHAHQTGALHINAGITDALLFFDAGNITHAECGNLFGDEAVIHIIKSCVHGDKGVYKFVYGATSTKHTVLRNATDLMLDAMREYDESARDSADNVDNAATTAPSFSPFSSLDAGTTSSSRDADLSSTSAHDATQWPSIDSEPSLLHSFDPVIPNATDATTEAPATNPLECGDAAPPLTNNTSSPGEWHEQDPSSPPVAQASLPAPEPSDTAAPAYIDATSVSTASETETPVVATTTIKRSDLLQAELATHPTTITDRILSDLRDHDNPVDRALAELLSRQLNGEYQHGPSRSDDHRPQPPDSDSINDTHPDHEHDHDHDHVRHSDDSDKELP